MAKTDLKGPSYRDLLQIFFSQKKVITTTFLGVTLLVLVISLITPPKYDCFTKILTKERRTESALESKFYSDFRTERVAFLQSQMEILLSDEVARRVLKKLNPAQREIGYEDIKAFQSKVKVVSPQGYDITNSDILLVHVSDSNPVRAAEAANQLTDEYINYTFELRGKSAKQTIQFLEKHSEETQTKMKVAEDLMKNFEGKAGNDLAFLLTAVKNKGSNTELINLHANYLNAKAALLETEAYLKQLKVLIQKGSLPNKIIRENPVLGMIKDNITKLQTQLANLRAQFTDLYPKNKTLLLEIETNRKILKQEVDADIKSRVVDVIALEARVKALRDTVDYYTSLAQKQLEYNRLYRTYEMLEEDHQNLYRDIQKARTAEAMQAFKLGNTEIIDRAKVSRSPLRSNILVNTLLGALVGLLLGLGLAFVADYFDHTFRTAEDVERYLKISVLGSVPLQ